MSEHWTDQETAHLEPTTEERAAHRLAVARSAEEGRIRLERLNARETTPAGRDRLLFRKVTHADRAGACHATEALTPELAEELAHAEPLSWPGNGRVIERTWTVWQRPSGQRYTITDAEPTLVAIGVPNDLAELDRAAEAYRASETPAQAAAVAAQRR